MVAEAPTDLSQSIPAAELARMLLLIAAEPALNLNSSRHHYSLLDSIGSIA